MVGMLVLGGGRGHVMAVAPEFVGKVDLFWSQVCLQRGPQGPRSPEGTVQCSLGVAKGLGGPIDVGGSFQSPYVGAKGPLGPHLLWVPHLGLVLASMGPQGPRVLVSCHDLWGVRIGTRDVRRAPYYYVVGYSGIYAGGQVQSYFP